VLMWLRPYDLRLDDNEALIKANSSAVALLPVYVFDPRDFEKVNHCLHAWWLSFRAFAVYLHRCWQVPVNPQAAAKASHRLGPMASYQTLMLPRLTVGGPPACRPALRQGAPAPRPRAPARPSCPLLCEQ